MKLLHSWASSEIAGELNYIFLGISFHKLGLMQSSICLLDFVCCIISTRRAPLQRTTKAVAKRLKKGLIF